MFLAKESMTSALWYCFQGGPYQYPNLQQSVRYLLTNLHCYAWAKTRWGSCTPLKDGIHYFGRICKTASCISYSILMCFLASLLTIFRMPFPVQSPSGGALTFPQSSGESFSPLSLAGEALAFGLPQCCPLCYDLKSCQLLCFPCSPDHWPLTGIHKYILYFTSVNSKACWCHPESLVPYGAKWS